MLDTVQGHEASNPADEADRTFASKPADDADCSEVSKPVDDADCAEVYDHYVSAYSVVNFRHFGRCQVFPRGACVKAVRTTNPMLRVALGKRK